MLKINMKTGFLNGERHFLSPFYCARPKNTEVDLLVVHSISLPPGEFGKRYIDYLFIGKLEPIFHPYFKKIAHLTVSAHLLIDRKGKITQYVSFYDSAWHAGESSFEGRSRCNDFSIGIELEGADEIPYELVQYEKLADVFQQLRLLFPSITKDRIVGHSDIAPGRKTDPGPAFDWDLLNKMIASPFNGAK